MEQEPELEPKAQLAINLDQDALVIIYKKRSLEHIRIPRTARSVTVTEVERRISGETFMFKVYYRLFNNRVVQMCCESSNEAELRTVCEKVSNAVFQFLKTR